MYEFFLNIFCPLNKISTIFLLAGKVDNNDNMKMNLMVTEKSLSNICKAGGNLSTLRNIDSFSGYTLLDFANFQVNYDENTLVTFA